MIDWTALAAVATALSAIVVAFQTYYTRKAAEQTKEAAGQTARAVEVSVRSAEGTEAALVEAAKGRLDARAPLIRVLLDEPEPYPLQPSTTGGRAQQCPSGTEFRLPRDREEPLILRVGGRIQNRGTDVAVVYLNAPLVVLGDHPKIRPVLAAMLVGLEPGTGVTFEVDDVRPLATSVQSWNAALPPSTVGQVSCSDSYDDGVVDRWIIRLDGRPVEPIPGEDEGWRTRNVAGMPPVEPPTALSSARAVVLHLQACRPDTHANWTRTAGTRARPDHPRPRARHRPGPDQLSSVVSCPGQGGRHLRQCCRCAVPGTVTSPAPRPDPNVRGFRQAAKRFAVTGSGRDVATGHGRRGE